jgi:hypothetical protein
MKSLFYTTKSIKSFLVVSTGILFLFAGNSAHAQLEVNISYLTNVVNEGDTIEALLHIGDSIIKLDYGQLSVENTSQTETLVMCKRMDLDVIPGTNNTFCWAGSCYPGFVYVSTRSVPMAPGSINSNDFSGIYNSFGIPGSSYERITFFDSITPADSTYFVIKYNAETVGIDDVKRNELSFSAYPNPTTGRVNVELEEPIDELNVYTITMQKIEVPFSNQSVDLTGLPNGAYIIEAVSGQLVGRKRVILVR